MSESALMIENDRDEKVRSLVCPVCKAPRTHPCKVDMGQGPARSERAHTARYLLAASRGLVPLLPGTSDTKSGAGGGVAGSPTTRGGSRG